MMTLATAALVIHASVPPSASLVDVLVALRSAARTAGCPEDWIHASVRTEGPQTPFEIEIRCREPVPRYEPPP